jgi:hypothetical protein
MLTIRPSERNGANKISNDYPGARAFLRNFRAENGQGIENQICKPPGGEEPE